MTLHVCAPPTITIRRILDCPTCKQRRRFVVVEAVWYGGVATCCACGDSWADGGYRLERPFARGWRNRAVEKAKRMWNEALPRAEAKRAFLRMLEESLA